MMEQGPRAGEKSIAALPLQKSLLWYEEHTDRKQKWEWGDQFTAISVAHACGDGFLN